MTNIHENINRGMISSIHIFISGFVTVCFTWTMEINYGEIPVKTTLSNVKSIAYIVLVMISLDHQNFVGKIMGGKVFIFIGWYSLSG